MSYDLPREDVPVFVKRIGDYVAAGSNNSLFVLGTDRIKNGPADISSGLGSVKSAGGGKAAGSALLVVGRKNKDPDLSKDSATFYMSMKCDVDKSCGTVGIESDSGISAAAILKTECIRIIGKKDLKIVLDGKNNYIHLNGNSCTIKIDPAFIKISPDKIEVNGQNIFANGTDKVSVTTKGTAEVVAAKVVLGQGGDSSQPNQGVVTGESIDSFTGMPFFALQQSSAVVFAKK